MGKISDAMQNVVNEIRSSATARNTALRGLIKDTHHAMKDIHNTNQAQSKAVKEKLSSEEKTRMEATREFMEDIGVKVSEIRSGTQNLLERFGLEHGDMTKALQQRLSSEEKTRMEVTRQFMEEVHRTNDECREIVKRMLDQVASDLREASEIWTKGLGKKAVPEALVKEPAKKIEKKAKAEKEKILEVIARHPEGIKLVDIGNERGVDWRTLIGSTKSLVDEDKVEKIDNMYYPKKED